ncbi:hypothetical protein HEP87_42030 [Streptomyces sp. S1D4-11]|nr:hypothetical protein [Streptomyces sp. S1D4-11]QIY99309.1 hypothetical protein HEP87_42030 [Streptomyces sp. S1D4-11]
MQDDEVVAQGVFPSGEDWQLTVTVRPDNVMTMLSVTRQGAAVFGGGMGGPALGENETLNLYWGREGDFLGVVVRAAETVAQLTLAVGSAEPTEVQLYPIPRCPGVKVAALGLTVDSAEEISLSARDEDGHMVETRSLPVAPPARPAGTHGGGWAAG